ncbi:MAG: M15 family metallopeptidase [Nanoarchaeota archaeon]
MKNVISDYELMKIPVKESGEYLVSLKEYSKDLVIAINEFTKEYEQLKESECYVRESVALMLAQVQSRLSQGMRLKVVDGFRSLETQKKLYIMVFEELKQKNPTFSEEMLKLETDKWVANPSTVPPHSTGGAIDLTIIDVEGNELPMGSSINTISEKSVTDCENLSSEEKKNRSLLITIMSEAGFTNYPLEWWHWNYGDRMWAHFTGKEHGIYEGLEKR